ncbi:MAG: autotransporter outer membrane beta-barrel domain-containing protein [Desulfuromonadales bacterium]|nr:autotransporter outer membrane beta-barrel domain-containing protein [Desulfuromonadales bacterium]
MNKIFKTIWNETLGTWVAVAEITKTCKSKQSKVKLAVTVMLSTCFCFGLFAMTIPTNAHALYTAWTGTNSTDWNDPGNWSSGTVPGIGGSQDTTAVIGNGAANQPVIDGETETDYLVRVGDTGGTTPGQEVTLTIQDGGSLTLTRYMAVAYADNTNGYLSITGTGSTLNITSTNGGLDYNGMMLVAAGVNSVGIVNVSAGASVSMDYYLDIAGNTGSVGTVTVDNATMNIGNYFTAGDTANGTLSVLNGGIVNAGTLQMPTTPGESSFLTSTDTIGYGSGSNGQVIVSGPGSILTSYNPLVIGGLSPETIQFYIENYLFDPTNYDINGDGSEYVNLVAGNGTLTISNGGTVVSGAPGNPDPNFDNTSYIGGSPESTGTVTVTDPNSTWTVGGSLAVGGEGQGTLTIANSGVVSVADGVTVAEDTGSTGEIIIGAATGSTPVDPGTLNTPTVTFGSGTGDIVFNHTSTGYIFAPAISGAGTVNQEAGTTIFTADNTYTGGTNISGGTLQLGDGGTSGSIVGDVADNGILAFDRSDSLTLDGVISGTGVVNQIGSGTTTLTGVNTYSGGTNINAGTLQISADDNLGAAAGILSFNGGTLNTTADITSNRATTLNAGGGTFDVDSGTTLTMNGNISGAGSLTKTDTGTLLLAGTNNYSGGTTVAAGTIILTGTNTGTGGSTVDTGATLQIGNNTTTGTIAGNITNNGTLNFDRSNTYTYAGTLSGTGSLAQSGTGTTTLSGAGSTQGSVLVQAGGLTFTQAGVFNVTGNYETQANATTSITGATSTLNVGGEFIQDANSTLDITKGTSPVITALSANINGTLNISGYSATTPTKSSQIVGIDYVIIHTTGSASNGITGDFTAVTGAGSSPVDYLLAGGEKSADGNDYLVGYELTWTSGTVTGNGNFTLAGGSSFELDDTALNNEAASATGWNGQDLTEYGSGTLILDQINGYTGSTTINGGVLELNQNGNIAASDSVTINNGTLDISNITGTTTTIQNLSGQAEGNIILAGKNLTINQTQNLTYAGNFDVSNGSITKNETGTLTLSGQTNWTGETTINQGALTLDGSNGGAQLVSNVTGQTGAELNIINHASLTGIIDPIDVNINTGGTWNITGNLAEQSTIGTLTSNGGNINFEAPPTNSSNPADYKILNATALNGATAGQTPSIITMNTNLAATSATAIPVGDLISTVTTSGNYAIKVTNTGGDITGKPLPLEIINASNQPASTGNYTLTNGPVEVGLYNYNLLSGQQRNLAQADWANWYLTPSYGKELITLLGASDQTGTWLMTNDSLLQRMGELRTASTDEQKHPYQTWIRGYGWQSRVNTNNNQVGYKENTYGVDFGADKVYNTSIGKIYTGLMAGYTNSRRDMNGGAGQSIAETIYGGAYGTWINDKGYYLDAVAKIGHIQNNIKAYDEYNIRANYGNWGISASLETGRQFKTEKGWYIEPQVQGTIVNFTGANFTTSGNAANIEQRKTTSYDLRAGIVAGKNVKTENGSIQPYIKGMYGKTWTDRGGIVYNGDILNANTSGDRYQVGAGIAWQVTDKTELHVDYEYIKSISGAGVEIPWKVNAGYRYNW